MQDIKNTKQIEEQDTTNNIASKNINENKAAILISDDLEKDRLQKLSEIKSKFLNLQHKKIEQTSYDPLDDIVNGIEELKQIHYINKQNSIK